MPESGGTQSTNVGEGVKEEHADLQPREATSHQQASQILQPKSEIQIFWLQFYVTQGQTHRSCLNSYWNIGPNESKSRR